MKEEIADQGAFSTLVKNQALKILDDYSLSTGRKWQAIRNEIVRTIGANATEASPLLTRQDLESWALRKSTLGDEKFKLVFEFLTHPKTLARPEFSEAKDLLDFGVIERVGGVFADFFDGHAMSGYIRRVPFPEEIDEATVDRRMSGFEGCFTGSDGEQDSCLSIERYRDASFFVCHFFSWPTNGLGEISDWDIERFSGFCTISNLVRLHTKGVMIPTVRDLYIVPQVDHDSDQIDIVHLILDSLVSQSISNVLFGNFEAAHNRLKYVDPTSHTQTLQRAYDDQLTEFIDQFRWNIVL